MTPAFNSNWITAESSSFRSNLDALFFLSFLHIIRSKMCRMYIYWRHNVWWSNFMTLELKSTNLCSLHDKGFRWKLELCYTKRKPRKVDLYSKITWFCYSFHMALTMCFELKVFTLILVINRTFRICSLIHDAANCVLRILIINCYH